MHATWSFLVKTEDLEGIDRNNFSDFWSEYYDAEYQDGDNWFLPMVIIHDTGEVIPTCEDGAYRGTDSLWKRMFEMPISTRWDWMMNFVAGCISIDFDVPRTREHPVREMSVEDILRSVDDTIPDRLERVIEIARGNIPERPNRDDDPEGHWDWYRHYDMHRTQSFLRIYSQLLYAKANDRLYGMFGRRDNIRCGYRAMQLHDAAYFTRDDRYFRPVSLVVLDYHY